MKRRLRLHKQPTKHHKWLTSPAQFHLSPNQAAFLSLNSIPLAYIDPSLCYVPASASCSTRKYITIRKWSSSKTSTSLIINAIKPFYPTFTSHEVTASPRLCEVSSLSGVFFIRRQPTWCGGFVLPVCDVGFIVSWVTVAPVDDFKMDKKLIPDIQKLQSSLQPPTNLGDSLESVFTPGTASKL